MTITQEFRDAGDHQLLDGTEITLRKVRSGDANLFIEYFQGLSERSRYFFRPFDFTVANVESVAGNPGSNDCFRMAATIVCHGREIIVGYAWLEGLEGKDVPMLGVGIIDDYQERGLGRLMLLALLDVGRDMGIQAIRLGVNDDNPRAIHVYESVGFRLDQDKSPQDRGTFRQIYMIHNLKGGQDK